MTPHDSRPILVLGRPARPAAASPGASPSTASRSVPDPCPANRSIVNPWFMSTAFLGALVLTIAAAISHRGTPAMPWIIAALALYLIAVFITIAVNVPLNAAIKAAGAPDHINVAQVREKFPRIALGRVEPRPRRDHHARL